MGGHDFDCTSCKNVKFTSYYASTRALEMYKNVTLLEEMEWNDNTFNVVLRPKCNISHGGIALAVACLIGIASM